MNGPLPWQLSDWCRLTAQGAQGRLPHAVLLVGPVGTGKRRFAEALTACLCCRQPADHAGVSSACGRCPSCRQWTAGVHPDVLMVEPEAEDKPLKIDQIRLLGEFMIRSSHSGGYKIAILEPAERMNANAANALLKTLEEPPPERLLILVSHRPIGLPATVRSRCQRLTLPPPPPSVASSWLAEQLPGREDTALLLRLARGAPLRALAMADEARLAQRRSCFADYCRMRQGRHSPDRWSGRWTPDHGAQTFEVLEWLLSWQQDMIRLKLCASPPSLINPDFSAALSALAERASPEQLFRQLHAIQALPALLSAPVNVPLQVAAQLSHPQEADD